MIDRQLVGGVTGHMRQAQGERTHDDRRFNRESLVWARDDERHLTFDATLLLPAADLAADAGVELLDLGEIVGMGDGRDPGEALRPEDVVPMAVSEDEPARLGAALVHEPREIVNLFRVQAGVNQTRLSFADEDAAVHDERAALSDPQVRGKLSDRLWHGVSLQI